MNTNKKIKQKFINLEIAPYNWSRMRKYIKYYNEKPDRSTTKLKFNDLINQALDEFFTN